jgi:hypothetical protein
MGLKWHEIPSHVQIKIEGDILRCFGPDMESRYFEDRIGRTLFRYRDSSFSTFIRGCALLGYRWENTNDRVRHAIFSTFCQLFDSKESYDPQTLINILSDMRATGLIFRVSPDVQNTIFRGIQSHFGHLQPPQLAKFLYG